MLLTFAPTQPAERSQVLTILDDAAAWLRQRGITQWPARFSGRGDWRTSRITSYVDSGASWLVRIGDEPVATFALTDVADPDYADGWPGGPASALYLYRMAVRRTWAGHDIGGRIIEWASSRAYAQGHRWLRLDCHRDNRALQQYYENRGFLRVGTLVRSIDDNGTPYTRGSGALYQRTAGTAHYPEGTGRTMTDRYDPTGEAAVWQRAAELVADLHLTGQDEWNAALEQASRVLENEARSIRQRDGMYYRVITGSYYEPLPDE